MCACTTHQEREKGYCVCTSKHYSSYPYRGLNPFKNDGCLNFVDENDEVLISGFGRRGKAKGDIPGVRFKVVKVSGVGLLALWKEKKVRFSLRHATFPDSRSRKSQGHNLPSSLHPWCVAHHTS
jgi:hypothetical protein